MGLLEKKTLYFDNIHLLLRMRQKVWKLSNVSPNNLYKLHFWDNLYKLHPWLNISMCQHTVNQLVIFTRDEFRAFHDLTFIAKISPCWNYTISHEGILVTITNFLQAK